MTALSDFLLLHETASTGLDDVLVMLPFACIALFSGYLLFDKSKRHHRLMAINALTGFTLFFASALFSYLLPWWNTTPLPQSLKLTSMVLFFIFAFQIYSSIQPTTQSFLRVWRKNKSRPNGQQQARMTLAHQREQEALLRDSTDSVHVGILVVNTQGCIIVANQAVCEIFGYTKSELEGQHINYLVNTPLHEYHRQQVDRFISDGIAEMNMAADRIVYGKAKNGKSIPIEVRLNRRKYREQHVVFASLQDITHRLAAEKALTISENITQRLIRHLPLGLNLFELDSDTLKLISDNPHARIMLKYNAPPIGATISNAFPGIRDPHLLKKLTALAISGSESVTQEVFYEDGGISGIFQLYIFSPSANRLAVLFEDITLQKHTEAGTREQEAMMRKAINASIAGVYVYNIQQRQNRFINERYTAITGYTLEDLIALKKPGLMSLIHKEDQRRLKAHVRRLLSRKSKKSTFTIQYRIKHAAGHWLWLMAQDVVFERDEKGYVTRFIGSFLDITPMRNMQENLRTLKEEAEQASQTKGEFLANMSHEIRTPMNAIIALTELVLKMELGNKQREYLNKVQGSSRSLLQLLNDILDYSKLEADKLNVINAPFDLFEQLSSSLHLFSANAKQKDITLDAQVDANVPRFVIGDNIRLMQIINNLLGNAIKFTDAGGVSLQITADVSAASSTYIVRFIISDTGIGISEEKMNSLFESFYQADSSIDRRFGGTGLGLAISKKLASLLNGTLTVHSEEHRGSTFTLNLPLVTQTKATDAMGDKLNGRSFLYIGNNLKHLETMNRYIEDHQASVAHFPDEPELDLIIQASCDILILDMTETVTENKQRLFSLTHALDNHHPKHGLVIICDEGDYLHQYENTSTKHQIAWLVPPFLPSDIEAALLMLVNRKRKPVGQEDVGIDALYFHDTRVLLVEDHSTNQFVASELLNAVNVTVDVANDGEDGFKQFQQNHYDLVLMDLQMPKMDGYTASKKIRLLCKGKHVPIYAMSAAAQDEDFKNEIGAGMDGHIAKPIVRNELYQVLQKRLAHKIVPPNTSLRNAPEQADNTAVSKMLYQTLTRFDLDTALARLGNDGETYVGLLHNFYTAYNGNPPLAEDYNDAEALARRLHSLKGLGMTLGASRLEQLSKEAEKAHLSGVPLPVEALQEELALVLNEIHHTIDVVSPLMAAKQHDTATDIATLTEKLKTRQYIRESDIHPYESMLIEALGENDFARFKEAILKLDYRQALSLLDIR